MKTIVCHSAQNLRIENTELPALGENQLRVDVAYGGIGGSDLHYYQHGGFGTVRIQQPIALGHDISGVVDAVGAGVSGPPMTQIVSKEVGLRDTFRFHAEFATAVRFLNEDLINAKPVITGILPVDRAIEAFDLATDKSQSLKVQISSQNA